MTHAAREPPNINHSIWIAVNAVAGKSKGVKKKKENKKNEGKKEKIGKRKGREGKKDEKKRNCKLKLNYKIPKIPYLNLKCLSPKIEKNYLKNGMKELWKREKMSKQKKKTAAPKAKNSATCSDSITAYDTLITNDSVSVHLIGRK